MRLRRSRKPASAASTCRPPGTIPARCKLNSRASVADTAIHEGFPGHDWHYKFMTQHAVGDFQHPVADAGRGRRLVIDVE